MLNHFRLVNDLTKEQTRADLAKLWDVILSPKIWRKLLELANDLKYDELIEYFKLIFHSTPLDEMKSLEKEIMDIYPAKNEEKEEEDDETNEMK